MVRLLCAAVLLSLLLTSCAEEQGAPMAFERTLTHLPPGPLGERRDHSLVWSGDELLVWGGDTGNQHAPLADGAAYSPADDTWRSLEEAPLAPRTRHTALWLGDRMFVWGGFTSPQPEGSGTHMAVDGALYDPATDSWEPIADAPEGRSMANAVLVGDHVVISGGLSDTSSTGFLVYSLSEDSWSWLLDAAAEGVTIHEMVAQEYSVIGLGTRDGAAILVEFTPEQEGFSSHYLDPDRTVSQPPVTSVGLAVNPAGELLGVVREAERVQLLVLGDDGTVTTRAETDASRFRPPVSPVTSPLGRGAMYVTDDGLLVATADGQMSIWSTGRSETSRGYPEDLDGFCGPLVPMGGNSLLGWGGLGCETPGVHVELGS